MINNSATFNGAHKLARSTKIPSTSSQASCVAILYENDAWLGDLFKELHNQQVPFEPVRLDDAAVILDEAPMFPTVFNRVSPSSYIRGHGPAIGFAKSMLDLIAANGRRIINDGRAFRYETSKAAQVMLFQQLGVATPRTLLFNSTGSVLEAARSFTFPALLKPNCGGSGAFIRHVKSYEHLVNLLESEDDLFGPDHLLLLQEYVSSRDGSVVRIEFVDGQLICAMRAFPTNTFNLCPAESCERTAANPASSQKAAVRFEPYPDIPPDSVAQAREIARAANIEVGGVEYIEAVDGTRVFIDINASSVYRQEICEALGTNAIASLVEFISREYHKELAKDRFMQATKASAKTSKAQQNGATL
ncbi:MAG: hypothetical protein IH984_12015 [Planctomycetes bacterium]|nr:hypothetical protein [Planctomycetota bacterium]